MRRGSSFANVNVRVEAFNILNHTNFELDPAGPTPAARAAAGFLETFIITRDTKATKITKVAA
jgi:hypothetical protein